MRCFDFLILNIAKNGFLSILLLKYLGHKFKGEDIFLIIKIVLWSVEMGLGWKEKQSYYDHLEGS